MRGYSPMADGKSEKANGQRSLLKKHETPMREYRRICSFPVLLGALLVFAVLPAVWTFHVDGDTWWHLMIGQEIIRTHSWPLYDTHSFTAAGVDWMAYEWLSEVILAWAMLMHGLSGLMSLLFGLASGTVLLIYYYAYLRCRNAKAAFLATLAVLPLAAVWFTVHPQLLGYLFLPVVLICLELFRQGRRRALWLLPVVFMLWVNAHGTFVFGYLALGIYWLSGLIELRAGGLVANRWTAAERMQMAMVTLASLAASCITPYGSRLLTYPAEMFLWQQQITATMTSWQPIPLNVWHGKLFLGFVLLFIAVVRRPTIRLEEFAMFSLAVIMTAIHARALPLFAIVFAPLLASLIAPWVANYDPAKEHFVLNAVLIVLLGLAVVKGFPSSSALEKSVDDIYPRGAVHYLRQHPPPGRMFNDLGMAGYLLYELGPAYRVFIDGRLDIYQSVGVLTDYLRITGLDSETFMLLRRYDIGACLVPPHTPLAVLLADSAEWQEVYRDGIGVLFLCREVEPPSTMPGEHGRH
jgi:hypothetical protein